MKILIFCLTLFAFGTVLNAQTEVNQDPTPYDFIELSTKTYSSIKIVGEYDGYYVIELGIRERKQALPHGMRLD